MRDLGLSREQFEAACRDAWKRAKLRKRVWSAYKEEKGLGSYRNDEQSKKLERSYLDAIHEGSRLNESGVVPWLADELGNVVDGRGSEGKLKVWARRVFNKYAVTIDESPHGGRMIQLVAETAGTAYTLGFMNPETVQMVIDQLQYELDRWDEEWTGEAHPGFYYKMKEES